MFVLIAKSSLSIGRQLKPGINPPKWFCLHILI